MSDTETQNTDAALEFVQQRKQILFDEWQLESYISQFAVDFVEASLERNKHNLEGIKYHQLGIDKMLNDYRAMDASRISLSVHEELKRTHIKETAKTNLALEVLENCNIVLEEMMEFINEHKETA